MKRLIGILICLWFPTFTFAQSNVCLMQVAERQVRLCESGCNNCSAPVSRGTGASLQEWATVPNVCYDSPKTWPTDDWLPVWDRAPIYPQPGLEPVGDQLVGGDFMYIYVSGQTTFRADIANDKVRYEACANGEPQPPVPLNFSSICYYTASQAPVRLCETNNCDNCAGPSGRGTIGYKQEWSSMPFVCRKSGNGNWYVAGAAATPPYEFSQDPQAPLPAPGVQFDAVQQYYIYISGETTARGDYSAAPAAYQNCIGLVPPG